MSSAEGPARLRTRSRRLPAVSGGAAPAALVDESPRLAVRSIYRYFWPFARPYRWLVGLTVLLSLAESALQAAGLWVFKSLVDSVLVLGRSDRLPQLSLALAGVTLGTSACGYFGSNLSSWVSGRFLSDVRREFFNHLLLLSPDFFERSRLGDVLSRLSSDVAAVERFSLSGLRSSATAVFRLGLLGTLLVVLSPRLALFALLVGPLFWLVATFMARRARLAARQSRRRAGELSAVAEEALANVALVQLSRTEVRETARFAHHLDAHGRAELTSARIRAGYTPAIDAVELVGGLGVIWVGASEVRSGALTLGELLIFIAYLTQLYGPLRRLGRVLSSVQGASASAERVIEFFDRGPDVVERTGAHDLRHAAGEIRFENVTFRYPGADRDALRGVSFTLRPGESVAIVGPNGAGKSTIMKLLLRWYDVDSGAIRIDGHDVRDLTLDSLRRHVAVVLQESLTFDGTIAENIAYGNDGVPDWLIVEAARQATADGFVAGLTAGYQHRVGQKGRRLSGGQRQKVAIARALLKGAPVVVLDEPTASLDPEASRSLTSPLGALLRGRTTIVISHDLLTVRDVDRVLVLDGGTVVEEGSHDRLLAAGGRYAALFRAAQGGDPGNAAPPPSDPEPAGRTVAPVSAPPTPGALCAGAMANAAGPAVSGPRTMATATSPGATGAETWVVDTLAAALHSGSVW